MPAYDEADALAVLDVALSAFVHMSADPEADPPQLVGALVLLAHIVAHVWTQIDLARMSPETRAVLERLISEGVSSRDPRAVVH